MCLLKQYHYLSRDFRNLIYIDVLCLTVIMGLLIPVRIASHQTINTFCYIFHWFPYLQVINNLPVLLQYSYRADMFTGSSIFGPFALYIETVANNVFIVDVSSKHQIHPWNLFHLKINKFTKRLI